MYRRIFNVTYLIVNNEHKEKIELLGSDSKGYVRIWDFHKGHSLKSIQVATENIIHCICLWNSQYIFVETNNKIRLFDINENKVIKSFKGHKCGVSFIQKIKSSKYGECLVSQGFSIDKIILWINKSLNIK